MIQTLSCRRQLSSNTPVSKGNLLIFAILLLQTIAFSQSGTINKAFGTNGFRFTTFREPTTQQASTHNVLINENADTYSIVRLFGNTVAYKRTGDGRQATNYGDAGFSDHFSFGDDANCLLPDGSILFAGYIGIQPSFQELPVTGNLVLGKLNKYGKWDQQFGPGGLKVLFQVKSGTQVIGMGILSNGKILVVLREFIFEANRLILVTLLPRGTSTHHCRITGNMFFHSANRRKPLNFLLSRNNQTINGSLAYGNTRQVLVLCKITLSD